MEFMLDVGTHILSFVDDPHNVGDSNYETALILLPLQLTQMVI